MRPWIRSKNASLLRRSPRGSATFQYLIGLCQVAHLTSEWMAGISTNRSSSLVINIILFLPGTFMDVASTILICTPIFLPIAQQHGWTRYSSAS